MSKIELEVDGFEVVIDPEELEIKEEFEGEIPSEEEAAEEDNIVGKHNYDVTIYREAVGTIRVTTYDRHDAIEKAEDQLLPSEYELEETVHTEINKIGTKLYNVNTDEEYEYNAYILDEYGYDVFELKDWQLALLQSAEQTTLKEWGVTKITCPSCSSHNILQDPRPPNKFKCKQCDNSWEEPIKEDKYED